MERSARGYAAEMAIEYDERLSDGIHDGLRQVAYILNSQEGLDVGYNLDAFDLTSPEEHSRRAHERGLSNIAHSPPMISMGPIRQRCRATVAGERPAASMR
jgi:hypothetical protein